MARRWTISAGLVTGLALAGSAAVAAPAAAAPRADRHYEGSARQVLDCGFPVEKATTYSGSYAVRATRSSGGHALLHDTFQFTDVFTNADGETFTKAGRVNLREVSAQPRPDLGPGVYEITTRAASRVVVTDGDGDRAHHGAGLVVFRVVLDTATGTPLEEPEVVSQAGQHPLLERDDCALARELIPLGG